jgi:hypothetical protein
VAIYCGAVTRPAIRVDFADFWPGFDKRDNWFVHTLGARFDVTVADDPDLLIYSCYGSDHLRARCTRVLVSWENRGWGFSECDWAFTSDLSGARRHYRLPLWVAHLELPFVQRTIDPRAALQGKTGFASIVVSNSEGTTRNRIQQALAEHRPVASGGRFGNNVGSPVADKHEFITRFKFNIAFENSSYPGYTTEKLVDALKADTVPIYWGNPKVANDFNRARMVNYHDFASEDRLVRRIIELDEDDDAYCEVLSQPWFPDGVPPVCADRERFLDRMQAILDWPGPPVGQQHTIRLLPRRVYDRWAIRRRYVGRQT